MTVDADGLSEGFGELLLDQSPLAFERDRAGNEVETNKDDRDHDDRPEDSPSSQFALSKQSGWPHPDHDCMVCARPT